MTKTGIGRGIAAAAVLAFVLAVPALRAAGPEKLENAVFRIEVDGQGISSLRRVGDAFDTDYIERGRALGHLRIVYRMGDNPWRELSTAEPGLRRRSETGADRGAPQFLVVYNESEWNDYFADLEIGERFRLEGDALYWTIHLRNLTHKPVELGDIILPLPFNGEERWDKTVMTEQRVAQHRFVSGHGSFLYWQRPNGVGPFLVMTPVAACPLFEPSRNERNFTPSKLEYADGRGVFIHSRATGEAAAAKGGSWRQPHTSAVLSPKFSPNDEITYIFKFRWAAGREGVRAVLVEEGLFDVSVVPGMTLPSDLEARIAIRSRNDFRLDPEHPSRTTVEEEPSREKGTRLFRLKFSRLGENLLRLRWGRGQAMVLEFFITEPLETVIKKRAAFLVARTQHRNPDKWYDGLFSEWDMKARILRSPEDTDGLLDYVLACDDPGLCKAPYVAAKNVHFPVAEEVEAVEYYIRRFVWGGLQQADGEPFPYSIYGIDNWKKNRASRPEDRDGWTGHLWRLYDYPHIIHLYLSMARIARLYPTLVRDLDARGYLERAWGTAMAYFTVPEKLAGWAARDLGTMDEVVINDLLDELEASGMPDRAASLRRWWENKIEHWINDAPDLFHSEFPFDPTGFEAYGGFLHYAMEALRTAGRTLKVEPAAAARFMEESVEGNLATRGWLEAAYHTLGSEGSLRYMSQMGGWALLDYALHFSADPAPFLRIGYASFLSSWCLVNSGTPESGYGAWYPAPENDGAAGSSFMDEAFGRTWLGKDQKRGPWQYGAEIDLGFGAALRTAATIVVDDPVFGVVAHGGALSRDKGTLAVVPRDGLRKRLHVLRAGARLHVELERDGFAAGAPIRIREDLGEVRLSLENRTADAHGTSLRVWGDIPGEYEILLDGTASGRITLDPLFARPVALPVRSQTHLIVLRRV